MTDTIDHLKPIEPREKVLDLCRRIKADSVDNYAVHLELEAFEKTRTPHDGRRLANALRHVAGRPDLAEEVERLLSIAGDQWTELERARMKARTAKPATIYWRDLEAMD